jgi:hypothetical protein
MLKPATSIAQICVIAIITDFGKMLWRKLDQGMSKKEARRLRQKGMAPNKEDTVVPPGEFQG